MGGFSSSRTSTIRSAPGWAPSGNPHWPEAMRVPVARTRSPTTNAVPCDESRPVPRPTSTPRRQRPGSEAPELTYKGPTGAVAHELLYRHDEQPLEIVDAGRPSSFDGRVFRLCFRSASHSPRALVRPGRSRSTHRSSSRWRHQITADWEAMLPRQPLRFLQPDDPGAGKTSMAGLFIKELTRSDFDRVSLSHPRASRLASRAASVTAFTKSKSRT